MKKLVSILIFMMSFSVFSFAQEKNSLPEQSLNDTKKSEMVDLRKSNAKLNQPKKSAPTNSASAKLYSELYKTQYSFLPKSYMTLKWQHWSNKTGSWQNSVNLNLPGSFYLLTTYNFLSSVSSKNEADFRSYSLSSYLLTPHYADLGIVGSYSSAGSESTNIGRVGVYYWYFKKEINYSLAVSPMILYSTKLSGRFLVLSSFGFTNYKISCDPTLIYTWTELNKVMAYDISIGYNFWESFSFLFLSKYSKSVTNDEVKQETVTKSEGFGLQIKANF